MWYKIDIDSKSIKRQSEKAYQLMCPSGSRYAGYVFWVPKSCVKFTKLDNLEYMTVCLNSESFFELKRFTSRKLPPLTKEIAVSEVVDCFRIERDLITIRKDFIRQNQEADKQFEEQMKRQTINFSKNIFEY